VSQALLGLGLLSVASWLGLAVVISLLGSRLPASGLARMLPDLLRFAARVLQHRSTPASTRAIVGAGMAYALSPIGIIPDAIPVIGKLDNALVLVLSLRWAGATMPHAVLRECCAGLPAAARVLRVNQSPPAPFEAGASTDVIA